MESRPEKHGVLQITQECPELHMLGGSLRLLPFKEHAGLSFNSVHSLHYQKTSSLGRGMF